MYMSIANYKKITEDCFVQQENEIVVDIIASFACYCFCFQLLPVLRIEWSEIYRMYEINGAEDECAY